MQYCTYIGSLKKPLPSLNEQQSSGIPVKNSVNNPFRLQYFCSFDQDFQKSLFEVNKSNFLSSLNNSQDAYHWNEKGLYRIIQNVRKIIIANTFEKNTITIEFLQ